nr:hypothetical protein [Chitinispirillaceae bacterium]
SQFSGKDLRDRTIVVTPVLTAQGALPNESLEPARIMKFVAEHRGDLRLVTPDGFHNSFASRSGTKALEGFYDRIFRADFNALQSDRKFWDRIGGDYLMALKIVHGLRSVDEHKDTIRQVRVEGELWRRDAIDVLWRVAIDTRCVGAVQPDSDLLMKAIVRAFEALPGSAGYGKGQW